MVVIYKNRSNALHPIFGLAASRETTAMENARNKNFRHDKRLQTALQTLDNQLKQKVVHNMNKLAKEREFMDTISPNPNKKIVCPLGLSTDQRQTVRLLRRSSIPSMSLNELEEKISTTRQNRNLSRESSINIGNKLSAQNVTMYEFQIKRKLCRRNSDIDVEPPEGGINLLASNGQCTSYPLYRRKSIVGQAYQRLTSADVTNIDVGEQVAISPRGVRKDKSPRSVGKYISPRSVVKEISPRSVGKDISPRSINADIFPRSVAKAIYSPGDEKVSDCTYNRSHTEPQIAIKETDLKTKDRFPGIVSHGNRRNTVADIHSFHPQTALEREKDYFNKFLLKVNHKKQLFENELSTRDRKS